MFDIIIIGSGPAGAHCAQLLGQNKALRIALIDARAFGDQGRSVKSCGGLLSSHAQEELRRSGLVLPESVKVEPQLTMVDTCDFVHGLQRFYPRAYINMDRSRFEDWLIEMIPSGVTKLYGTRVIRIETQADGYRLTLSKDQQVSTMECTLLVGADGADSLVRRTLFADRPQPRRYVSIQKRYHSDQSHDAYYGFFDERITDFYSWALLKNDELLVGSALRIDGAVHENFNALIATLKAKTDLQLDVLKATEGSIIVRPLSLRQLNYVRRHVALIGEASGSMSPTSAEGFSFALKSARLLAESVNRYGTAAKALRSYDVKCWRIRLSILFKLLKYPGMYHPLLRKWVMKSGITSIKGQ